MESMTDTVEDLGFNGGTLVPGDMMTIAPSIGGQDGKPFVHNGKTWIRNHTAIIDKDDLDESLHPFMNNDVISGESTFNNALGTISKLKNGDLLIILNYSQIYYISKNNGDTYTGYRLNDTAFRAEMPNSIAVNSATGTVITSGVGRAVLRSTDNAVSFGIVPLINATAITSVYWDPISKYFFATSLNGRIYRSTNDGSSWSEVLSGMGTSLRAGYTTANNGRLIVVTTEGDIRYSDNQGSSWSQATESGSSYSVVQYLGNNIVVAGSNDGAYISTNNGVNWSVYSALNAQAGNSLDAIWSNKIGKAFFACVQLNYEGTKDKTFVYRTLDYGATVERVGEVAMSQPRSIESVTDTRFIITANTYHPSDHNEPHAIIDHGFATGADINNKAQATLIKNGI